MRKLKVLAVWGLISVLMQVGFLYFLEREIKGDPLSAETSKAPVIVETSVVLPTIQVKDMQASYAKEYLAYSDNQGLKVFNVKTSKVVFTERNPAQGDILGYRWLPDRNTLLFVMAKPNPAPKTVKPQVQTIQKEDPRSGKMVTTTAPTATAQPYYNPQLTEMYAVDFGDPEEDTVPDKRLARKIDDFPAGGKIEGMDFSTYTNLIYLQVKTSTSQVVYEIDVMKNIRPVQRAGEKIGGIAASDKKGTLYMQSTLSGINQIVAVKHSVREQLIRGNQYVLLGVEDNKVLVGEVINNTLTKILSLPDTGSQEKISNTTTVEWQGNIAWEHYKAITGQGNVIVLYNQQRAVIFEGGKVREYTFTAKTNYLTADGREVMELTPDNSGTKVTIKSMK